MCVLLLTCDADFYISCSLVATFTTNYSMLQWYLVLPQHPFDVVTAFDGLRYHSGKKDAI